MANGFNTLNSGLCDLQGGPKDLISFFGYNLCIIFITIDNFSYCNNAFV